VILDPKEIKLFSNLHASRIREIIFLLFSPTYLLIEMSRIEVSLNIELDSSVPSNLFQGCIIVIGLANMGGGIRALSNSLILYLSMEFLFSIYPTDIFKYFPVASWICTILDRGTPFRSNFELDFP